MTQTQNMNIFREHENFYNRSNSLIDLRSMPPNGRKRIKSDPKDMKEIIHSGHFMVSDIDDPEVQDGDDTPSLVVHESDCDQETLPLPEKGFDFESACKETSENYTFGNRYSTHSISIDASLTKLFECMTLAYSGKLTSPRWKQFKGLKLRLKEKIRLNNMIWRAWHMQFVMKIKTDKLCQFATPLDGDFHMKPEAVVIEGTYWKRKMANITAEYKKWRLFYRDRFRAKSSLETENMDMDWDTRWPTWQKDVYSSLQSIEEDFIMDFSDTLFTSFNPSQPFDFPNPREIAAKAGIADFIQPGLVQLQPAVEDFMDTFEPLSDLFSDFLNSKLPPLPEEGTYNSGSLQDLLPPSSEQQDVYGHSKPFGRSAPNFFSRAQSSSSAPFRRSNASKKRATLLTPKPLPQSTYLAPPSFPDNNKTMMGDHLGYAPDGTALLSDSSTVPLMPPVVEQLPSQQTFLCNPSPEPLMESLLQQSKSLPQPPPLQVNQMAKREQRTFFHQPAFASKSFDESDMHQPVQVPLQQTFPPPPSETDAASKTSNKHPLFFSVSLGPSTNAFKMPNLVQQPTAYQSSAGKPSTIHNADSPAFRRHSYTTVPGQSSGDYMSSRRSRPIAPANPSSGNFAVPEIPPNRRTRSRSVSSPQSSSPKTQQPMQAVSLTDISSSMPDPALKPPLLPGSLGQNINVQMQQNAILAQLLTPGGTAQDIGQAVINVTSSPTANVSSPVTIIRPILSTAPQTLIFPTLSMATTTNMNDLPRSLFVSNTSVQLRDSPTVLSAPDSPSSTTCSSTSAITTNPFEASSSVKAVRRKSDEEKIQYKEHRRVCHINAEQKRRCNIKNGFESLHNLLPPMGQTPSSKISKAAMLQRGAEYIRTLKTERQQQNEEAESLKKQIDELNQAIGAYQSQLPASGAPISCQRTNRMKEMFSEYVRQQTLQNWKFYIVSFATESIHSLLKLTEMENLTVQIVNVISHLKSLFSN